MELWLEYARRHKLEIVDQEEEIKPFPNIVVRRRNYVSEELIWKCFLTYNRNVLEVFHPEILNLNFQEQKEFLFAKIPYLKSVFEKLTKRIDSSSLDISDIFTVCNSSESRLLDL